MVATRKAWNAQARWHLGSICVTWFDIRQLTDVSHCNLQQYLSCNRHRFPRNLRLPRGRPAPSPYT